MKRTLSLILALAMIMSMVTTVSFAEEAPAGSLANPYTGSTDVGLTHDKWPVGWDGDNYRLYHLGTLSAAKEDVSVTGGTVFAFSSTQLIYRNDDNDYYYKVTVEATPVTFKVFTLGNNTKWTKADDNTYYYTQAVTYGDSGNFYAYSTTPGVTLASSGSAGSKLSISTMTVSGVNSNNPVTVNYETNAIAWGDTYYLELGKSFPVPGTLAVKTTFNNAFGEDPTAADIYAGGIKITQDVDESKYYYDDGTGAFVCKNAAVFEGKTGLRAEVTNDGGKKLIIPLTIDKTSSDVEYSITNGSWGDYTYESLKTKIQNKIGKAPGETITLFETAADSDNIYFYKKAATDTAKTNDDLLTAGGEYVLRENSKFSVKTKADDLGERKVGYYTTASDSLTYYGTITFKSDYAAEVSVKQDALFRYEKFFVDYINGIKYLNNEADYDEKGGVMVDPSSRTDTWSVSYTGHTAANVNTPVKVTFTPVEYDILTYVEEGKAQFNFDAFETFAELVAAEQEEHHDISVDHIEFDEVSAPKKWTLMKGGKAIKKTDEFTESNIDSVYVDVTTAGFYDIPVSIFCYTKASKNANWSTRANETYKALVRVYAGSDGDITYEVSYGETLKFKSADFAALYKKMAGSKKVLETVKIDALPLYGALYRNNKVVNSYAVDEGDVFEYDPSSANSTYDLDKLIYWASKSSTSEYSVYIPVTMSGTGGEEVAVVEIIINSGLAFTDVAKGSTFYDYIKYCYDNDIMGGKTSTKFDAKSSITRAQLVTTLYRMAGSPTTYNNKTLPFTDTVTLTNKEFVNAIKWAYYNKIVGGVTATTFAPNTAVTRQAMVKILYGYAMAYDLDYGVVIGSNLGYYTDGGTVSASMRDAMNWALDYSLLSGNGAMLNPKGSTTRGAAAKILANFHSSFVG